MKLLPSIAFNDFSGSAGNVTARKVGDKTYLSSRTQHSKKKTPPQATVRCRFADTIRGFSRITEAQRQGWVSLARVFGIYYSPYGYTVISAPNLFVMANTYRKMCGRPLLADAPAEMIRSRNVVYEDLWMGPEHIVITKVEQSGDPDEVLYVEMSPAFSRGVSECANKTVFLKVCSTSDWGDIDLTDAYLKRFGTPLQIGQKVIIRMCWLNAACGFVSRYNQEAFTVRETSLFHGAVYYPRARITMDRITPLTEDVECEFFDYELSPGSKFTSVSITLRYLTTYLYSCDIPHNGLPDAFYDEHSFQYARVTSNIEYMIESIRIRIQNNSNKRIRFFHRDFGFRTHLETFGTYHVFN
ncbi:MAG: hypothetical protein WC395_07750 [Bacteroidales bacterium]|jgi:hypothetical protein